MEKKVSEEKMKLEYVSGVEGNSIYLNDFRIAGPKPWGGGKVLKSWEIDKEDVLRAIGRKP